MDVMSPLDSSFLRLENRNTSLHIASIAIFDGPPPGYDEMADLFTQKLPLLPRYRQRVREAPLWLGRPSWVDDPRFDLFEHLRHTALPHPGSTAQLHALFGRLMSAQLDRSKPLWECWLVEGLADGRWALINKVHHCMVDGIAGTDLLTTVLSPYASPSEAEESLPAVVDDAPERPGALERVSDEVRRQRQNAVSTAARLRGMLGFAELAWPGKASSLSGSLGRSRIWTSARVDLADTRVIKHELGGTVNDIVLALVTRGFRDLLLSRDEPPARHTVRTLVPVSVRGADQHAEVDNRITAMVADLPVQLADPLDRLNAVRAELDRLKRSGEPQAGVFVTELAKVVPPILVNTGLAGLFRVPQWFLDTVTTNVPGPTVALYAAGRRLRELYPYVPIADRIRIGVAVTSYDGVLYFGVTADKDSSSDVGVLTDGIEEGLRELLKLAEP
jgi:diacylglycerol O-acyltransferase / wax synthase